MTDLTDKRELESDDTNRTTTPLMLTESPITNRTITPFFLELLAMALLAQSKVQHEVLSVHIPYTLFDRWFQHSDE